MLPRTSPRRTGPPSEVYRCLAHFQDPEICAQKPVGREVIDGAMIDELDRRFLDLQATRTPYAARKAADAATAATAAETLRQGERDSRGPRTRSRGSGATTAKGRSAPTTGGTSATNWTRSGTPPRPPKSGRASGPRRSPTRM